MVAVAGISLDEFGDVSSCGAVALCLSAPSQKDRTYRFHDEGWEAELRRGHDYIVARTNRSLVGTVLIDGAIDCAHRALDLTSAENGDHLVTTAPAENFIVSEFVDCHRVVRVQGTCDFPIQTGMTITVTRPDGTIEQQPARPALAWAPAFRFYRLSQGSRDLFDAYRNMFLGLEAILDQLFPQARREGERAWLLRAIATAGSRFDLAQLATPGASDHTNDIVDRIYRIRINLFHAKTGRLLIPDERVSYSAVAETYPVLLNLWSEIARTWLTLPRGGGIITYQGFRAMIEAAYASSKTGVTADDTSPDPNDITPNRDGSPMPVFNDPTKIEEVRPGRMGLCGCTEVSALPENQVVGRILTLNSDLIPLVINSIKGGLTLDGANILQTRQILRLVNHGQPKTEFS